MSSIKNLDAARRLVCSLRAATALRQRGFDTADLQEAKALLDELSG
jgi:hypothetical protein